MRRLGSEEDLEEYLRSINVLPGPQRERAHLHENREELWCDIEGAMCLMEATRFFIWEDSEGKTAIARCPDHIPSNTVYRKRATVITRDEYIVARVLHT